MARTLPMFPLGSVLFPYATLPLHVFEPRYRALTEHCLAGDGRFGVVLIERGSEVGGGDTRFSVGTVAEIVRAGRLPDGRYVLAARGTQRLRVTDWLPDDPYPRADVELLDDEGAGEGAEDLRVSAVQRLTQVVDLLARLGESAPAAELALEFADDPARASYELAALAPIGPLDAQRLVEMDEPTARLAEIDRLLGEHVEILELRLAGS